jgi:MFS family permease
MPSLMSQPTTSFWTRATTPAKRIMLAAFLTDLAVSCLSLGVTFKAIEMGASPALLGILGTVGGFVYSISCIFAGRLSDRFGRRAPAAAGNLIAGGTWLVMLTARHPETYLYMIPFSAIAMALVWPSMQAWLGELCGADRRLLNRTLSQFNIAWTAGIMIGPLLAGLLWATLPLATFLMPTGVVFCCALLLSTNRLGKQTDADPPPAAIRVSPQTVHLFLLLAWLGNFASWYARSTVTALFPKLGDELKFTPALVGTLIFIFGIAQLATFGLVQLSERWHYHLRFLLLAEFVGVGGMVVATLVNSPGLLAAGFIAGGFCTGVTYVASLTYALHGASDDRGKRSGLHEAVLGTGMWLGPLIGGATAQLTHNMHTPFVGAAIVFVLAMLAQAWLWSARRSVMSATAAS